MIEIDGSYGEGGGQLLRTAAALAAITGAAITIINVRAKRANPGLAAQHLTAVKAVAALCDAEVDGLALKSQRLAFRPRRLRGGEFQFDVGTAGSITLVLQALLPAMIHSGERVRARIIGGTDVRAAPPLDYFEHVLLALLGKMGARVRCELQRRGFRSQCRALDAGRDYDQSASQPYPPGPGIWPRRFRHRLIKACNRSAARSSSAN